jgi:hypothetical protein
MNKLIILALVAIIGYHMFLKERFEVQKTNCSLYPIGFLCDQYKTKGCAINPNKVMGDSQDFCICADPSKGCEKKTDKISMDRASILNRMLEIQEAKLAPIRKAYNDFITSYNDWNNTVNKSYNDLKWNKVLRTYNAYLAVKPGAAKGGLPNDPDVIILSQGIKKDGNFNFAGGLEEREILFKVLGDEYKDLYTRYEMMIRQGM